MNEPMFYNVVWTTADGQNHAKMCGSEDAAITFCEELKQNPDVTGYTYHEIY